MTLYADAIAHNPYNISNDELIHDKIVDILSSPGAGLVQGSDEWHEFRKWHLNASEIGAVLGDDKSKSAAKLMRQKCNTLTASETSRENDPASLRALSHGHQFESEAGLIFCKRNKAALIALGSVECKVPKYEFLAASVDGIIMPQMCIAEIKCPYRRQFTTQYSLDDLKTKHRHYWHQIQCQMLILGIREAVFIQYGVSPNENFVTEPVLHSISVDYDPSWLEVYGPMLKAFWDKVEEYRRNNVDWDSVDRKTSNMTRDVPDYATIVGRVDDLFDGNGYTKQAPILPAGSVNYQRQHRSSFSSGSCNWIMKKAQ